MLLLANAVSWTMFGLGVVLMICVLLRRSWRYQRENRRSTRGITVKRPRVNRAERLIDAPPEVLRWQVEMHDLARDLKAELDSKMRALQTLIQLAQHETLQLEAAIQRAERLGISTCRDTLQTVEQLSESPEASSNASLPPLAETNIVELIKPSDQRSRIYVLHDAGQSPESIAQRMNITVGEVELILSVRPPKRVESE